MNQDQVKDALLRLGEDVEEFTLILSGKASKKVNGLYHPDTREIILHNKNFEGDDNAMMYTAIHEFAHHLHFCRAREARTGPISNRAHTVEFRSIFHDLLRRAEEIGIYRNRIQLVDELKTLADEIRSKFMRVNGELMKDFGQSLMEAEKLCRKHGARFEDFIERALRLPRHTANAIMKMKAMDLPPELGYENMKTLTSVRNPLARQEAIRAFEAGASADQVKRSLREREPGQPEDPVKGLLQEKRRLEKTLAQVNRRLEELELQLAKHSGYNGS